jgi:extradiol dioxygenase family protein
MIQGIDVVFLHTQDENLHRWYADVLGLEPGLQDDGWVEFNMQTRSRFAVEQVSTTPSKVENQPVMISFRVDNIYQVVETLAARGVQFHPTPGTTVFEAGMSLVATFQDPAGIWLQLSQPR